MNREELILKEIDSMRRIYEQLEKNANTIEIKILYTYGKSIIEDLQKDIKEVLEE